MRVLVGKHFGGSTLLEPDDSSVEAASIGRVAWGPAQLLRDLELRLGLAAKLEPEALRVARWQARIAGVAPLGRYYARSFEVEPLGTAEELLRLRDALVEAGWDGRSIPGGGRRLEALAELEQLGTTVLPAGNADRLAVVVRALEAVRTAPYRELRLAEPIELWSTRWQAVFRSLERSGARLTRLRALLRAGRRERDLGRLQATLAGPGCERVTLEGDGSIVRVTAETAWEAARATAALLPQLAGSAVVIRQHEVSALDGALQSQGLRTQGLSSVSAWRAALQVLPLALELAFEPKDPYRVLELLTLPLGPFQGRVGHELARALGQSPGIGSPDWEKAKSELAGGAPEADRAAEMLATIGSWLETPGADPQQGALKEELVSIVQRVRAWCLVRIAVASNDATLLAAAQQCGALLAALASEPRGKLRLVEARKLFASVTSAGAAVNLIDERAGRIDHVASPAALWAARDTVVWWAFDRPSEVLGRAPWRKLELVALRALGVCFPDPRALLAEEVSAARRAFACATQRLVLVSARTAAGKALPNHALWDELLARAGLDDVALTRLEVGSHELREPTSRRWSVAPPLVARPALDLPGGRGEWCVDAGSVPPLEKLSYQSLNALLGCPLRWVLHYPAGARPGGHALPPLHQLNGSLGHRLVELLQQQGAFDLSERELRERAVLVLGGLFQREGALLLRPGMSFERSQLERQLIDAVVELARALAAAELRITAVERPITATYRDLQLDGRVDLVVTNPQGKSAIVDMKWGAKGYGDELESGLSLQLALYAFAHATEHGCAELPDASYFSIKHAKLFGLASSILPNTQVVRGPTLNETWHRAARTLAHARRSLDGGRFAVTGLRRSVPVLEAHGVPNDQHPEHFAQPAGATCKYCGFDGLCGRRWEAMP